MSRSRVAAGLAALALSGLGVFGLQSPALANHRCPNPAGHYPPGQCQEGGNGNNQKGGNVSDNTPVPGEQQQVQSKGHKPDSDAEIYAESTPILLGTFRANAQGVVNAVVTIPLGLSVGPHAIVVRGITPSGAALVQRIPITITAANVAIAKAKASANAGNGSNTTGIGGLQLPRTGTEIALVSAAGIALIGVGSLALVSGRRRRIAA